MHLLILILFGLVTTLCFNTVVLHFIKKWRCEKYAETFTKFNLAVPVHAFSSAPSSPPLPASYSSSLCLPFHPCPYFWVFSLEKISYQHIPVIHFQGTAMKRMTCLKCLYRESLGMGYYKIVRRISLVECSAR